MAVVAVIAILCLHFRIKTWISGAIVGFLWASSVGHWYSSWQLPNRYFNENVIVEGVVSTLQIQLNKTSEINTSEDTQVYDKNRVKSDTQKSFVLKLNKIGKTVLLHSPKIRLSWFQPTLVIKQGDTVKLLVSIKRPNAIGNEHGFNRQKWLASHNIVGLGNVKPSPTNLRLNEANNLRQRMLDQLLAYGSVSDLSNMRWILALTLGERSLLEPSDWKLLQTTGTAHLFAISGLHLGIVSFLFFQVAKVVLFLGVSVISRNKQFNIGPIALLVSVPFCIFYAYLSGFQVPVIRSLIALLFLAVLMFYQLYWQTWTVLLHLLICFFLLFPLSILGMSFWFSFGAIICIFFFVWRYPTTTLSPWSTLKQTIGLQLFLSVLMLPLIALNFGALSSVSALVNLIIMPFVSLILVPLCLIVAVFMLMNFHELNSYLLQFIDWCFEKLMVCMQVFASGEYASIETQHINPAVWWIVLGMSVLLFLPYWPHRKKVIVTLSLTILSLSFSHTSEESNWSVRVFDVGQGLGVLIKQNGLFLVYDTGQSFLNGSSYAESVFAPYFESVNTGSSSAPSIDYLVNSHMDNDHAGGNLFIFQHYNVSQWLSPSLGCTAQDDFIWGKLQVNVLWPIKNLSGEDNNHSCVLKVTDGKFSVLLTGDIEQEAEQALIKRHAHDGKLHSDILLAPHHGSKTSSTLSFIAAVSPQVVVISSKYKNQWGFPHPQVLDNYASVKAKVLNTAYDGEVVLSFSENQYSLKSYRNVWWSPWYMQIKRSNIQK